MASLMIFFASLALTAAVRQQVPISPQGPAGELAPQPDLPPTDPLGPPRPCSAPINGSVSVIRDHEIAAREQHNFYRAKHSSPPLDLNNTLNALAQKCAEYYAAKGNIDSTCPKKDSAGENQYGTWYMSKPPSCGSMANSATTFWYNAAEDYDYRQPGFSQKTGSFTQLVWKGSKTVGVGCAAKNGFAVFVALYSPAGNMLALGPDPNYFFKQNVLPPSRPARRDNEVQKSSYVKVYRAK